MSLQIFDTLAREKREFQPIEAEKIGMYVCGMTVYDRCHLGHGRVMVAFDAIVRYLRFRGFEVNYVRNITDVDDKIFSRAAERSIDFSELTTEMIDAMHQDEKKLGCQSPNSEPRATSNIESMLKLIDTLIRKGAAYQGASGDVYFRVGAFAEYGKLNNRNLDDMIAGARVAVADDKESPADFVLWKSAKKGEESWPSQFGPGRPGWHIECSAMSMDALGETFDIHGGGPDLKFPHHENEIAQSEAATGNTFARYWMHAGPVRVNEEKMSKSLGNFVTLDELFKEFHPEVVRFYLLQSHYRSAISFSKDALVQAEAAYSRLVDALPDQLSSPSSDAIFEFQTLMDDDFNSPRAIALLFELVSEGSAESASSVMAIGKVLGLFASGKDVFFEHQQALKASQSGLSDVAVEALIVAREQARKERDFTTADRIRDDLIAQSIVLEDAAGGTSWRRK
ncbi:MAG: cysteine--tRNA ligase [Oceanospirillales bacterium TMED33]|nr:cysteine--tRNA ligase [Gammaproteobacteria bacterium]RPG21421.1 MAG: cysteine--tRNA ligase [Oceanospirillales bacterium TMED33]CAI8384049.1 MAG: Cysteine--tRNA ligase [Gammaproteobacteria bacterium]